MSVEQLLKSSNNQLDQIIENKNTLIKRVRERLIEQHNAEDISNPQKFNSIRDTAWTMIEEELQRDSSKYLDSYEKADILESIIRTMFGYGVLDPLINNPEITEIMVNGIHKIFIEENNEIRVAKNNRGEPLHFNSSDELMYIIEKIVAPINRKVDESNPIVDARLPNGFRVNIVLNNISLDGTAITIRKFPENPYTMEKLVELDMLPKSAADFLKLLVEAKYNIIVSGGTGAGKTTFLNALSNFIGENERVITIEDAAELKLAKLNNLVRMETRPPNIEGKGEIPMRNLVRTALRMRPDRIIVGEVRGGEALDMLQAMNTGHDGSLSTGHANSTYDMLSRLETMVLMAGIELPLLSIRQQISSAVDIIVHLSKMHDGKRRVVQISEILGASAQGYRIQNIMEFKKAKRSGSLGCVEFTGNKMERVNKFIFSSKNLNEMGQFIDLKRLEEYGINVTE